MKKLFYYLVILLCSLPLSYGYSQTGIAYYQNIRLSPMPFSTEGTIQAQVSLNGQWDFKILQESEQVKNHSIQVPGEWEMQGYTVGEGETAVYSKQLILPADWQGKSIKLRFGGVSSHAVIKINGHKVAEHEGSFVPFEADITKYLNGTNNILTAEVQAGTISDILACTSQYAAHTVGGLIRDVTLFALPAVNLSGFNAVTTFDKSYDNAELDLQAQLTNEATANTSADIKIRYTLLDEQGRKIQQKSFAAAPVHAAQTVNNRHSIFIKSPHQWNPESPYLYTLRTELLLNGKVVQTNQQKIGFRDVEVRGSLLYVNGKSIKLRGVNRHSVYPLTGRSVSNLLDAKDALLFRDGNCNYIRTSHYPPSQAFLNACDSLGLFVESESSLCWINHGASPIWQLWDYQDEKFLPYMLRANIEKMLADRNHPAVIIWSLANESRWSPLWDKVDKMVKAFDPTRPTTFHDQCWGGFNNAGSTADIAVYHYPGLNGPQACDTMSRPVLFGEYAHISCYNRHELLTDPGIRTSYGKPLQQMVDSMFAHPANLGGAIWSGIDDIFQMPDGRIVGYGPWGPLDAWRRPKPEYWGMKEAYTPIRVTNIDTPKVVNSTLEIPIQNRYDFTNLSQVSMLCQVDGQPVALKMNVAPHSSGFLHIPVLKDTREVYVSFKDPRGFITHEEKIILQKKDETPKTDLQPVSFTETSHTIFVTRADVAFEISKISGIMTSVRKAGGVILSRGPVFTIVAANGENGGKPTVANESYQNDISLLKDYAFLPLYAKKVAVSQKDDGIEIIADIQYQEGNGTQTYHFAKDGKVTVSYTLTCTGSEVPRQYGLMFQMPADFDKLSWKRKGDFSTYAPDDISRAEGEARLNAQPGKAAEVIGRKPTGAWKEDSNEYGTNDFRSTKPAIYTASLSDDRSRVRILSDGAQSVRSWLQDKRIQLLVADYNSRGSEPFYGSPFASKELKLKDQTLKGKVIFVIDGISK